MGPWRMASDGRHKLVRGFDPDRHHNRQVSEFDAYDETAVPRRVEATTPLLFDRASDPTERTSVAGDRPDVTARLDAHVQDRRT